MGFIVAVSAFIIPLIIFYVVVDGITHQTDVYDVFVEGAKDGMKTVSDRQNVEKPAKERKFLFFKRKSKDETPQESPAVGE